MKCRIRLRVEVCLAFILALPLQCDECGGVETPSLAASMTATAKIVILKDGGVLTGKITPVEGGYLIQRAGAQIQVPAAQVFIACASLEEAYEARRNGMTRPSAESHLALATWCLRYGLVRQAAQELIDARRLDPNHPRLALLQLRLSAAEIQSHNGASSKIRAPVTYGTVDKRSNMPVLNAAEGISDAVVERFTRKVQPILVNNCTTSGCHHRGGPQPFQLDRALLHGIANRRATMHNLTATLALVDQNQPHLSPLLAIPRETHGNMRAPVFGPRQATAFNHLVEWVSLVTRREPSQTASQPIAKRSNETDTAGSSDDAAIVQDTVEQVLTASTSNTSNPLSTQARSHTRFGAKLQPWRPKDEFDPKIFNRQQRLQPPLDGQLPPDASDSHEQEQEITAYR
jgi:hypothetical protein